MDVEPFDWNQIKQQEEQTIGIFLIIPTLRKGA
jgi:hypothetical protein